MLLSSNQLSFLVLCFISSIRSHLDFCYFTCLHSGIVPCYPSCMPSCLVPFYFSCPLSSEFLKILTADFLSQSLTMFSLSPLLLLLHTFQLVPCYLSCVLSCLVACFVQHFLPKFLLFSCTPSCLVTHYFSGIHFFLFPCQFLSTTMHNTCYFFADFLGWFPAMYNAFYFPS